MTTPNQPSEKPTREAALREIATLANKQAYGPGPTILDAQQALLLIERLALLLIDKE